MWTRRQWLQSAASALTLPALAGCNQLEIYYDKAGIEVDLEALQARREEWQGEEVAFGVVGLTGQFLMVKHRNGWGWAFPGRVVTYSQGERNTSEYGDVFNTALYATYDQALISLEVEGSALFAYGYGIDAARGKTVMVYWYRISPKSPGIPNIQANLDLVDEVRWVGVDSMYYGRCLAQRQQEYLDARQGGTFLMERCQAML